MKKRLLKSIVPLLLAVCLLTGCDGELADNTTPPASDSKPSVSATVTSTTTKDSTTEKSTTTEKTSKTTTTKPTTTSTSTTKKTTVTTTKPTTTTTTTTIATTTTTTKLTTTTTKSTTTKSYVWIPTKGGKKYHRHAGCSNMEDPEQVTKSEAESLGFTPCKRCY